MEHLLTPYRAEARIDAAKVIVFAPHPDDEVMGCGGAICGHVDDGTPVHVVIVTDGALGDDSGEIRQRREWESRRAAAILGYGEPDFWRLGDQRVAYGEQLVQRIAEAIADANLVYAPSVLEIHPDHRAIGMAVAEAARRTGRADLRVAFYEIGQPLRPNLLLDITGVLERKTAALGVFESQMAQQRYGDQIAGLNSYRTYTLPRTVLAAEAFQIVTVEALGQDPFAIYEPEHRRQRRLGLRLESRAAPLVSVIVRSMDRPHLSDALDSIALQTYPNLEVVVVDALGAGHQSLPPWCGRYPLRVVGMGERLARSRAANLGLDEARGEFLIFLDDDDLFLPDHVATLVAACEKDGAPAAYGGVRVLDDAGRERSTYNQDFSRGRLLAANYLPIHAVLFRRDAVAAGCRFDESLEVFEDWDFWLQLTRETDLVPTGVVSAIYRAHLGASGLSRIVDPEFEGHARRRVWDKWLPAWSGTDVERLVAALKRDAEPGPPAPLLPPPPPPAGLAELQAHAAGLEATLAALKASTSWRITAPLRWLLGRRAR